MDGGPLAKAMDRIRLIGRLFFLNLQPPVAPVARVLFLLRFIDERS